MLFVLVPPMVLLQGCPGDSTDIEKEKIASDPDYQAKVFLRKECMDVYYFWRDEVTAANAKLKPYNYDIYDFFDKMLYSVDRWSWMCDKEYYVSDETGVVSGTWGVSLGQCYEYYGDYSLRVRYIYPGSPFEKYGVTRGAVLTKIKGRSVEDDETGFDSDKVNYFQKAYNTSPQEFTFRLADGRETTFTATQATSLSTRTTLVQRIFQPAEFEGLQRPVGYFNYLAFKQNFMDDVSEAMEYFHSNGIRDLILDLRYNGGGDSNVSQLMVNYLAPASANGLPYVVRKHSDYLASLSSSYSDRENTMKVERKAGALDLDHLYVITGAGTASASEMVINGLKPYMGDKLKMVGDTTYGKPNGMYVLMYPGSNSDYKAYNRGDYSKLQWVFLPICFFNQNSRGESIPWDGFIPDNYRPDDLYHDFGVEESSINACLAHLTTGSWPALPHRSSRYQVKSSDRPGHRIEVDEDKPNYGLDVVRNDRVLIK